MALVEEVIIKSPRVSASPRVCVYVCVWGTNRTQRPPISGAHCPKNMVCWFFFWATVTEGSGPAARQSSTWSWIPSLTSTPNPPLANCINQRLLHSSWLSGLLSSLFSLRSPIWGLGSGVAAGLIDILVYRPPCWRFPPNCRQFMEGSRRVTSCVRAWQQLVTLPLSLPLSPSLSLYFTQTDCIAISSETRVSNLDDS